MFAGCDCTLALAQNILETPLPPSYESMLALEVEERCALEGWVARFQHKYPLVGRLGPDHYPWCAEKDTSLVAKL